MGCDIHAYVEVKRNGGWNCEGNAFDCRNYGQFEDRRVTRQTAPNHFDGGCTADPGGGATTTYREFLGDWYFKELDRMRTFGEPDDVRVVFWFDN